jgi:pimeloyl-ACP methyl ester carboxylesterase
MLAGCEISPGNSAHGLAGPKATVLIVHGAWGGGWAFREVDALLTADGYRVFRPTLTGQGEKEHLSTPDINLSIHINDIVNVIRYEDLHDVILVGHSYGGMVITGVADRIPDRIRKRIYIDAITPLNGESVNDLMPNPIVPPSADGYMHPTWTVNPNPPHDVPMPAKTFSEKISLRNQAATAKIPTSYVLFVDPGKKPEEDRFYPYYQRAGDWGWTRTMMLETDHNPQWSKPRELVKVLEAQAK